MNTQPYPPTYFQALEIEEREAPEFSPESFGNPEEDPGWCREWYPFYQTPEDVSL